MPFFSSPLFGIVLCIFTFEIGVWLNRKTHSPLANPLLIAVALCIAFCRFSRFRLRTLTKAAG